MRAWPAIAEARWSDEVRSKYTTEYYRTACGGEETPAFDPTSPLPQRLAQALKMAGLRPGDDVLDLGSGRGELVHEAARLGCRAVGVDYSPDAVRIARERAADPWASRCTFLLSRADEDAPVEGRFDVIFALDVFEHLHRDELRGLLSLVRKKLKPQGRLVFHTSPNRYYYSVGYRAVYGLSRATGRKYLPKNSRSTHENEMHIGERTPSDLDALFDDAGLAVDMSVFGLERIVGAIHKSGLWTGFRRRLASWSCLPALRHYTNSDIVGIASHFERTLDDLFDFDAGEIPLDHPFFFRCGWYVPVGGVEPHRWTSPHWTVHGRTVDDVTVRFALHPWPEHSPRVRVSIPGVGSRDLPTNGREISVRWPGTERPISVSFTAAPALSVDGDPRPFGLCVREVTCEPD